jgi:hypothetical protein
VTHNRMSVPSDIVSDVMFASDSTCCVCCERGKAVQIHHVDENPANNAVGNLAVLCLECHNRTQLNGGFGRKLNATLLIKYRDEWLERVIQRRDVADRAAVEKMVGPAVDWPMVVSPGGSAEKIPYSEDRTDAILAYVLSLPDLRSGLRKKAQAGRDTGVTATMVQASYDHIDALQGVLVTLAGFYPRGSFGEDPHRFLSQVIASRFSWHRAHSEPHGIGTGGTFVNVICSGNVMGDVARMVEDMVHSLVGYDERLPWMAWVSRWRANTD